MELIQPANTFVEDVTTKNLIKKNALKPLPAKAKVDKSGWLCTHGPQNSPKYGIRRKLWKGPSPLNLRDAASDSPSTGTLSRSTIITIKGTSVTGSVTPAAGKSDITPVSKIHERSVSQMKRAGFGDVQLPPVCSSAPLLSVSRNINPKYRQMSHTSISRIRETEQTDFTVNPDPVPYQPQNFMSSTLLKKVTVPKRHLDSFAGYEYTLGAKRGVILHTDRYQWAGTKSLDSMSQRERLKAEIEYMEKLRGIKRRREVLPHRAQLDLLMGGKRVDLTERFDIQREIQKLKSLIMPQHAKDLFHGRGFTLPEHHASIKPRKAPTLDYEDDDCMTPAYLRRSRTNLPGKDGTNKALMFPDANAQKDLKVTPKSENVKRVEIPSATQTPRIPIGTEDTTGPVEPLKDPHPSEIDLKGTDIESEIDALESARDRPSSLKPDSPLKPVTPNPLKGTELSRKLPEEEQLKLKETFKKLDSDADGHLMFNQVQTQLPRLSSAQERFLKQVYDITSSSTFFGIEEFMTMSSLTKIVEEQQEAAKEAFSSLDFAELHHNIIQFIDLFQAVDRQQSGIISNDSLQEVLCAALETDLRSNTTLWNTILDVVDPADGVQISKVEYLAHIPYFLSLRKTYELPTTARM